MEQTVHCHEEVRAFAKMGRASQKPVLSFLGLTLILVQREVAVAKADAVKATAVVQWKPVSSGHGVQTSAIPPGVFLAKSYAQAATGIGAVQVIWTAALLMTWPSVYETMVVNPEKLRAELIGTLVVEPNAATNLKPVIPRVLIIVILPALQKMLIVQDMYDVLAPEAKAGEQSGVKLEQKYVGIHLVGIPSAFQYNALVNFLLIFQSIPTSFIIPE